MRTSQFRNSSRPRHCQIIFIPLSPEVYNEIREMQSRANHLELDSQQHEQWSYIWGDANFSLSKYYKFCFREIEPHPSFNWIWKAKNTAKLKVFCWLLLSDRPNTRNMLKRRNYAISSIYNCLLCTSPPEETVEHLFFHCHFSSSCWSAIGIQWPVQNSRLHIVHTIRNS
jgi:hypothetical protein